MQFRLERVQHDAFAYSGKLTQSINLERNWSGIFCLSWDSSIMVSITSVSVMPSVNAMDTTRMNGSFGSFHFASAVSFSGFITRSHHFRSLARSSRKIVLAILEVPGLEENVGNDGTLLALGMDPVCFKCFFIALAAFVAFAHSLGNFALLQEAVAGGIAITSWVVSVVLSYRRDAERADSAKRPARIALFLCMSMMNLQYCKS
jgi:hypothetical protein